MASPGKTNLKKTNKFVPSKNYNFRCSEAQIKLFKRIFDLYDDDHDGKIDPKFLGLALRAAGAIVTNSQVEKILTGHDPQKLNIPIDLSDYFVFIARILRDQDNVKSMLQHAITCIFTDTVVLKHKSEVINREFNRREAEKKMEKEGLIISGGTPNEKLRSKSGEIAKSPNVESMVEIDPNELRATIPLGILRSHLLNRIEAEDVKLLPVSDKLKLSYAEALEHFLADEKVEKCDLASRRAQSVYVDTLIDALLADKLNDETQTEGTADTATKSRSSKKDRFVVDEERDEEDEEDEEREGDD